MEAHAYRHNRKAQKDEKVTHASTNVGELFSSELL